MRRKTDTLLPIELRILDAGLALDAGGVPRFHGYRLASHLADREGARRLMSHGTLYRALGRLEAAGLLESEWEDPRDAADDGRPRRRLYRVTVAGARALAEAAPAPGTGPTEIRPEVAT